jgi:uncharacterized coiled-coil protein SlyX
MSPNFPAHLLRKAAMSPVLLAADILTEASGLSIGLALVLGTLIVGCIVGATRIEGRTNTNTQDIETLGERLDAEVVKQTSALKEHQSSFHVAAERSQKDRDDMRERIQALERKEGRADERVAGIERTLAQQNRMLEKMDGKLDDLMTAERESLRRRKTDAA